MPLGGDLTESMRLKSNRDAAIGAGRGFPPLELEPGLHTVTASVSDSDRTGSSAGVSVGVTYQQTAPLPEITLW